ncbi:MAG: hypothetical protein JNK02_17535 [Planctomycetes bacterium]|nr:hypothetical protein [Planctomycetota bacterium]
MPHTCSFPARCAVHSLLQLALACLTLLSCSAASPAGPQAAPAADQGSHAIRSALVRGEWVEARRLLDARLAAEPGTSDVWLYLTGVAFELEGNAPQALESFAAVEARFASSPLAAKARFRRAEILRAGGQHAEAGSIWEAEALRLRSAARQHELAQVYLDLADALSTPPTTPVAEPPRIDYDAAYPLYAAVLDLAAPAADRARALLRMGLCKERKGAWGECVADCERYLAAYDAAREPGPQAAPRELEAAPLVDVLDVRLRHGRALLALGQRVSARRAYEDLAASVQDAGSGPYAAAFGALDADGQARAQRIAGDARRAIAETYISTDPREAQLAVAALRRFLAAAPGHRGRLPALRRIADLEAQHGRTEQALAALDELLDAPDAASNDAEREADTRLRMQCLVHQGDLLLAQQRFDAAAAVYRDYTTRFPFGPDGSKARAQLIEVDHQRAWHLNNEGTPAEARVAFAAFLEAHPLDSRAADMACALAFTFHREASRVLAEAQAAPPSPEARARAQELWREAVAEYRRVAQRYPQTNAASQALLRVGSTLEQHLGDVEGAVEAYRLCTFGSHAGEAAQRLQRMTRPELALAGQGVWRQGGRPHVRAQVRNVESLRLHVYRLDLEAYFRRHGTHQGVENLDLDLIAADASAEALVADYRRYAPIEVDLELPVEGPGTWVVAVTGGELRATTLVVASTLDVIVKSSPGEVFVFAQDVARGEPAPRTRVLATLATPAGPRTLELTTGADGVARQALERADTPGDVAVLALRDGHVASVGLSLAGLQLGAPLTPRALVYTDRPAYRPGQVVGWRAIVREVVDGREAFQPGASYRVEVVDPAGRAFQRADLALSAFGTMAGEVRLDEGAPSGGYRIVVRSSKGGVFQGGFQVQTYQLQKVDLEFTFARAVVQRGERVEAEIRAAYYYGEPVADAALRVGLPDGTQVDLRTDARGSAQLTFDTRDLTREGLLSFSATLSEEGVTRLGTVRLALAEYSASLSVPRPVVLAGDSFEAELVTRDAEGGPLARALTFTLLARRQTDEGTWAEVELERREVTTDAQTGKARIPLRAARGGDLVLRAEATDRFGNPVWTQAAVTASGEEDEVRLRLIAERGEVEVGSRARVQIVNRSGAGLALLTLEAAGVLEHRLLRLEPGTSTVEVAIGSQAFPRAWVAIARMDGSRLHEHTATLDVVRRLSVTVEPLAGVFTPGGRARVRVSARDQLGNPVQAELSLAVVDEALFDLFPDATPPLARVFDRAERGTHAVRTAASCTLEYEGSTVAIAQEVLLAERERLAQADWALQRRKLEGDEFFAGRAPALGAPAPATGAPAAEEQREDAKSKDAEGGRRVGQGARLGRAGGRAGAGPGAPATPAPPETETAYWTGALLTGPDGTATAEFDLPGQSTRWRASARGVGPETLVGEASASFRTRSELFLELRAPLALVEGDRPRLIARVHNQTGATGSLDLTLFVTAGERDDSFSAQVELGAHPVVEHVFELLDALPACGTLALRLEAAGAVGGTPRALAAERTVPVRPFGLEGAATASGPLLSDAVLELEIDSSRTWTSRVLEIELGSSLQRMLVGEALGASFGIARSAGCLPPRTIADAAAELYGITRVQELVAAAGGSSDDAPRLLARAVNRIAELVAAQREDGAWPWTRGENAPAHPETSCLALAALGRAAAAGLQVPPQTIGAAIAYLNGAFRGAGQQDDELKAQILWALAIAGQDPFEGLNRLHRARGSLSPAALAYSALALVEIGRSSMAADVAEALAAGLSAGPGPRHVPLEGNRPWNQSRVDMTALAAYALGRALPSSPRLSGLVDALVGDRPWYPARARGFALAALAWHAQSTRPIEARSEVALRVDAGPEQRAVLAPGEAGAVLRVPIADSAPRKLRVELRLRGGGRPFYTAVLRGFTTDTSSREAGGLRLHEQRELAAPPLYRGREIPIGFQVARNVKTWENRVEHLPLGAVATFQVSYRAEPRARDDARSYDHLVLEIPLPAGVRVLEDSLRGTFEAWRQEDGRLVVDLGARTWLATLEFRVLGTLPGRWRVPPAVLRSAHDASRWAVGTARDFEVLPRGARSTDAYRATPDELYHLGRATYQAGERDGARTLLERLFAEFGTQLEDQPLRDAAEMLLYLALEQDDAPAVVRYFEILREKNPDLTIPFEAILRIGAAYRRLDEHERALLIFKATIEETFGKDLRVVGALDAAQDAHLALRTFARLLDEYPDFPGVLEAQLALSDRLLKLAPKAHEDPSLRKAKRDRAALTAQGIGLLQRFLAMHPKDPLSPAAGLNLVGAYLDVEDHERTAELGRELSAVYTEPRFADAFLYSAAVAEWYRGQDARAEELLKRIAAATWKDAAGVEQPSVNRDLALYILAQIHHARTEFGAAAEYYQRVESLFADARQALAALREKRIALPEVTTARPGERVRVKLSHRNVGRAEIAVYPVDLLTLYLREKTLANVAGIELAGISPTQSRTIELRQSSALRPAEEDIELALPQAGAYLVLVRGDEQHASGLVLVSDLDLQVQEDEASGQMRIQVLRREPAGYVRGAEVRVVGSASQRIVSGKTDPRGLFVAEGIAGTSTVIARLGEREYAFFRGERALQPKPKGGPQPQREQLDQQGYFRNVLEFNATQQQARGTWVQQEIERDRSGVQVKQVK